MEVPCIFDEKWVKYAFSEGNYPFHSGFISVDGTGKRKVSLPEEFNVP